MWFGEGERLNSTWAGAAQNGANRGRPLEGVFYNNSTSNGIYGSKRPLGLAYILLSNQWLANAGRRDLGFVCLGIPDENGYTVTEWYCVSVAVWF